MPQDIFINWTVEEMRPKNVVVCCGNGSRSDINLLASLSVAYSTRTRESKCPDSVLQCLGSANKLKITPECEMSM